jgi:hypothetical protein
LRLALLLVFVAQAFDICGPVLEGADIAALDELANLSSTAFPSEKKPGFRTVMDGNEFARAHSAGVADVRHSVITVDSKPA